MLQLKENTPPPGHVTTPPPGHVTGIRKYSISRA